MDHTKPHASVHDSVHAASPAWHSQQVRSVQMHAFMPWHANALHPFCAPASAPATYLPSTVCACTGLHLWHYTKLLEPQAPPDHFACLALRAAATAVRLLLQSSLTRARSPTLATAPPAALCLH